MPNRSDEKLENKLKVGTTLGSGTESVTVIHQIIENIHAEFMNQGKDLTALEHQPQGYNITRTVNHLYDKEGRISKVIERIRVRKANGR